MIRDMFLLRSRSALAAAAFLAAALASLVSVAPGHAATLF
jgi:hypothetical protein